MSIFWLCAENQETMERGFRLISHKISQGPQSTGHRGQQEFKDWLQQQHRGKWLVIFDNTADGLNIRDLLPSCHGKVIITSRYPSFVMGPPSVINVTPSVKADEAM